MLEAIRQKHHQGWEESNLFSNIIIMTFKKWQKPPKKWQKMTQVEEIKEIVEETPVTTDIENEISDAEIPAWTTFYDEEEIFVKKPDKVIWTVGDTVVTKPKGQIAFEAQVAPVPMFKIPADIRQYLMNNGFTTDVYKKDKEWLDAHNVDMEMIDRLKDFLTRL